MGKKKQKPKGEKQSQGRGAQSRFLSPEYQCVIVCSIFLSLSQWLWFTHKNKDERYHYPFALFRQYPLMLIFNIFCLFYSATALMRNIPSCRSFCSMALFLCYNLLCYAFTNKPIYHTQQLITHCYENQDDCKGIYNAAQIKQLQDGVELSGGSLGDPLAKALEHLENKETNTFFPVINFIFLITVSGCMNIAWSGFRRICAFSNRPQ